MKKLLILVAAALALSGCVTAPVAPVAWYNRCPASAAACIGQQPEDGMDPVQYQAQQQAIQNYLWSDTRRH